MTAIKVHHHDGIGPFGAHYVIMAPHCVIDGSKIDENGDERQVSHVAINFNAVTDMLVHHMAEFERGAGDLNIDGHIIPKKVYARAAIDIIATIIGNHGVSINLAKIRNELCPGCLGLGAPAQEFINGAQVRPEGIEQPAMDEGNPTAVSATLST